MFPKHLLPRIKPVGIDESDALQNEFKENIRPIQNSTNENHGNDTISSSSMPSRKRKADQNTVKTVVIPTPSAYNEEIDAYTFIDDSPVPMKKSRSKKSRKQKRSPVNLKRKRSKQQWPIIEEKIEPPRKRPKYSFKVKTPVGKAALKNAPTTAPKIAPKTDMERILENVRQINAMVSERNGCSSVASSSSSYQSASKNQAKINTIQSTTRSLNPTHFSGHTKSDGRLDKDDIDHNANHKHMSRSKDYLVNALLNITKSIKRISEVFH